MAEVEKAVSAILLADAAVTAITTVIFPDHIPQREELPAVLFGRITTDSEPSMSRTAVALIEAKVWVESHAMSYLAAKDLATAVRKALDMKRGEFGGVQVRLIFRTDEGEDSEVQKEGSDEYEHTVAHVYSVAALESVA